MGSCSKKWSKSDICECLNVYKGSLVTIETTFGSMTGTITDISSNIVEILGLVDDLSYSYMICSQDITSVQKVLHNNNALTDRRAKMKGLMESSRNIK